MGIAYSLSDEHVAHIAFVFEDGAWVETHEYPLSFRPFTAVELRGGRLSRWHLRTGSYANWPALAAAVPGNLLPDFPLINKSFELCYACADR